MVFKKLSETDKEQLAIFKAEHGTNLTSSMRALVMRGSSTDDAKKLVLSRQTARAELVEEMEKEVEAHKELQEPPPAKARKPRGPNKPKGLEVEPKGLETKPIIEDVGLATIPEDTIPEDVEPNYKHIKITHMKAKAKAKAAKVQVDESSDVNILC